MPLRSWIITLLLPLLAWFGDGCLGNPVEPPRDAAPAHFKVRFDTSRGPVILEITRADAPNGVDRFYDLVKSGYLNGDRFFRVVPGFVVQFGLAGDPNLTRKWQVPIRDDPVRRSNTVGSLAFATVPQPNARTTQLFINLADNPRLDSLGFAPFGRVVSGMSAIEKIYARYGEQPDQDAIEAQGNAYLEARFPKLDYIRTAQILAEH